MPKESQEDTNRKSGYAYAAATALVASVIVFCGIGWFLDRWFGTQPWCLVGGLVMGSAAGLYEFIRISSKTY